jgi:hypothetical protein
MDFEDGTALTGLWTTVTRLDLVQGGYESTTAMRAAGDNGQGAVGGRLQGTILPARQTLAYRVRVKKGAVVAVASRIDFKKSAVEANIYCRFELRLSETSARLVTFVDGIMMREHVLLGHPGADRWFHVELRLASSYADAGDSTKVLAHVLLDGKEALAPIELETDCQTSAMATNLQRIELGAQSVNAPSELTFDDVVFDGK